jgi:hypothetical protein
MKTKNQSWFHQEQLQLYQKEFGSTFKLNQVRQSTSRNQQVKIFYSINPAEYVERIIDSENVLCIVMSTYRLDVDFLQSNFPFIFSSQLSSSTHRKRPPPTLILHGDRGKHSGVVDSRLSGNKRDQNIVDSQVHQQQADEEHEISTPAQQDEAEIEEMLQQFYSRCEDALVELYEVTPQLPASFIELAKKTSKRRDGIRGELVGGVHHPKYTLIFTEKGLHCMISTANLTNNYSIDGTWTEFFPRLSGDIGCLDHHHDFGFILQDFLQNVSNLTFYLFTLSHAICISNLIN